MKLHADVGDQQLELEIKRDGEKLFADIDGRVYELEVSEPEPGVFLFKNGAKIDQIFASKNQEGSYVVIVAGREIEVELSDPKRLRGSGVDDEHAGGLAEIKTAMPGKVVRILVAEGDVVAKGDGVIVVEAMKMQNEMKSTKDGVIVAIKTAEGATVAAGDILVTIE